MVKVIVSEVRKCGKKQAGGIYIDSEDGSPDGTLPMWTRLDPPIPCADKFHRSAVIVDGAAILAHEPEENWLTGSSKDRSDKMRADEWGIERFGMTINKRLSVGECSGLKGPDEAMEKLLGRVSFSVAVVEYAKDLVLMGVHELPRATEHYASFVRNMQTFAYSRNPRYLVAVAAATWQIADGLPPKKRSEVLPTLVRIMAALGLIKDAMALREVYT